MKKLLKIVGIGVLFSMSLGADCKIVSSPATNIKNVAGTDALALSISRVYFDKNKKIQIKSYSSAFIDFNKKAVDYIKKDCKKYKIKNIYNFRIQSNVDKDYYHFNATYDFSKTN